MTNRKPLRARGWALALLCCVGALNARADDSKADAAKAQDVLRRTAEFYKKAKSFAVDIDREQKVGAMSMKAGLSVAVERPNKLALKAKGDAFTVDIVSDGKTLAVSIPALKKYTQGKAPASFGDANGDPMAQSLIMGTLQGTLLAELISDDPYKSMLEGVKTSAYVGQEVLDGGKTHHLKFTQDEFDWEVWIAAEGDPLVRKAAMDMTKSVANTPAAEQLKGQNFEMVQLFKGWKINVPLDEKTFAFQPPPGAQKAESLAAAFGGDEGDREAPSPLVGKAAPDISLKLLEKGEFRLKDHRDKNIVMLDFWATWCGPCVQELPILSEVAEAYKNKGVAFVAVNLNETPEQIKKFQESKKLKFTVALDTDGAVGTAYGANAIPLLVLVDKKGTVQSVHVGYNPAIKATLSKELDALLAGKDLAKEAGDQAKAEAP
jgi:thiol-disulfide isomerase/thioredoxin